MTKGDGKPCKKCGTSAWHDSGNCVQCTRDRVRKWKKENPDRVEENHRNYRKNSPDKTLRSNQKWRKKNPDKVNEMAKNWRDNNPEKAKEISRRYTENHLEERREKSLEWYWNNVNRAKENARRWYENNSDRAKEYTQEWRRNNPDKIVKYRKDNLDKIRAGKHRRRTRESKAGGSYTIEEFKALCDKYDNRCLCCKKKKKLTFDHVIPVSKGGSSNIENGQPLCGSCNSRKGTKIIDYRT